MKIASYTVYKCLLEDGGAGVLEQGRQARSVGPLGLVE